MANTPSNMVPLGTDAPTFDLPNPATGQNVSIADSAGQPLLVMFICNHCPFVIHLMEAIDQLDADYAGKLSIVAINANDAENYPQDRPEKMAELVAERGWSFPFLYDESQEVAKAYNAACTPDFFLFDDAHTLVYRGQFDDTRPGGDPPTGRDLRGAIDALLAGEPVAEDQRPSMGCNIKWKA